MSILAPGWYEQPRVDVQEVEATEYSEIYASIGTRSKREDTKAEIFGAKRILKI